MFIGSVNVKVAFRGNMFAHVVLSSPFFSPFVLNLQAIISLCMLSMLTGVMASSYAFTMF